MNAFAQLCRDINVITGELARRGIHSDKILEATYSIETNARAYMEDSGGLAVDWKKYGLAKKPARICALLHKRLGKTVSRDAILDAMYFDNTAGEDKLIDARKLIDVFVCQAKKKLERSPFSIDNDWGEGFRMTEKVDWTPYKLSPTQHKLAVALHANMGRDVSVEDLLAILYPPGYKGKQGYERKAPLITLHVQLCNVRRKLERSALRITHSQAAGYRMIYKPSALAATALQELQAH